MNVKNEIIKSVSAVVCVALLCSDIIYCTNKIVQTQLETSQSNAASCTQAENSATYFDSEEAGEQSVSEQTEENTYTASQAVLPVNTGGTNQKQETRQSPSSKAEILNYFNTAVNRVKGASKSIYQARQYVYKYSDVDLGKLGFLSKVVNGLIESNVGDIEAKTGVTAVTQEEKIKMFPVTNETWSSKLTLDDIKNATIKENGSSYEVKIFVLDDELSSETVHGKGHHGKAFSIQLTQTVVENAGAASSIISGLKIGYSNGTITAQIDKASGNITKIVYDYVWTLYVPAAGGITVPFGTTQEFYIKW
ncbi:MAG: hypothetical protein ACI4IM_08880 [Acutalibacteraceae bacterium]